MPYSEDETRRFRPEDGEEMRRRAAEDRRVQEYAARQERARQAQRERERRERRQRNEALRKKKAQEEARRKKAAAARQREQDALLLEAAEGTTLAGKLFITLRQRQTLLRWSLYALVFFTVLLLQNVIFSRITAFGCVIDIVPPVILLIAVTARVDSGCTFALCASLFWSFSGQALGLVAILALPVLSFVLGALRRACFPKNLTSSLLCCLLGGIAYEFSSFFLAVLLGYAPWAFWYQALVTAVLSFFVCPVLYPLIRVIGKIGGFQWND